ncbi:MAG: DUF2306 domain-containing protein [Microbacteriaceae bacterium]
MTFELTVTHPSAGQSHRSRPRKRRSWLAVTGLLLLSLIPVIGGAFRLIELTGGADITTDNARFFASPIPIVAHIVSVTVYSLLGAFQFVPSLRGRRGWHRAAGSILFPAGLVAALSGIWMAAFYRFPEGDDIDLLTVRLVFGGAMAACLVLGIVAIRRRDFTAHGAWMTRAYGLGVAAGTQALVLAIWIIGAGPTDHLTETVLMAAAWAINVAVAELVILRRARAAGASRRPATA